MNVSMKQLLEGSFIFVIVTLPFEAIFPYAITTKQPSSIAPLFIENNSSLDEIKWKNGSLNRCDSDRPLTIPGERIKDKKKRKKEKEVNRENPKSSYY